MPDETKLESELEKQLAQQKPIPRRARGMGIRTGLPSTPEYKFVIDSETEWSKKVQYARSYLLEESALAAISMRRLVPLCVYAHEPLGQEKLVDLCSSLQLDLITSFQPLRGSSIETLMTLSREPLTSAERRAKEEETLARTTSKIQANATIRAAIIGGIATIIGAIIGSEITATSKVAAPPPPIILVYPMSPEQRQAVIPRLLLANSADEVKQIFTELSGGTLSV